MRTPPSTDGRRAGRGRRFGSLALAAVGLLVLSSCSFLTMAENHQASNPSTRPWWCTSMVTGHEGHMDMHYMNMTKGMLSWPDCLAVSTDLDAAKAYALQYPTAGQAEANGFSKVIPYAAGMGTHHAKLGSFNPLSGFDPNNPTFPGTALDDQFDPKVPEFLQYDGNGPNAKLIGMSWYVRTTNGMPPAGFPGINDMWHVHPRLCFAPPLNFKGADLTDQQCSAQGGVNLHLDNYYMVHAWIVPGWELQSDVFAGHHPCLPASGPITDPNDPCHSPMAMPMPM